MRLLFGDCILDPTRRELSRGGEAIHVQPQVFDLLLHLVRNREQVVSKDDMLAAVWGGRIISESTLNNRINAARHAIGDSGEHQHFIRTIARRGVRFVGEVKEERETTDRRRRYMDEICAFLDENEPVRETGNEPICSRPGCAVEIIRTDCHAQNQVEEESALIRANWAEEDAQTGCVVEIIRTDCHAQNLVEEASAPIRANWAEEDAQTPGGRRSKLDGKPVAAVLPFNNMSGDPGQEYFSDGITEDIITALSKHRSLLVIARNSAFAFKGHGSDIRRIGAELRADYIVEGSVRKTGQGVRITAHLIEAEGGRLVWAEQYDRDLEEIFELQDEITTTIAARIEPGIGTAERLRAERKPPGALQAWDLFHLGMKQFYNFSAESNREAQRLFRRAGALDPNLAQAYAFLSYAIVLGMLYFDAEPDDRLLNEAESLARKGVQLDDQDALIRFTHGRVLLARGAYSDALAELKTALELNPSLPVVYCGLGDTLAYEGRYGDAIPYFERAINLSPYDPQRWTFYSYGALAQIFARKFDEAFEWAQRAIRFPNCHYWPFAHRVAAVGHIQREEDLQIAVEELLQRKPEFSCGFARKRLFYVRSPLQLDGYVEGLRKAGIPQ